MFQLPVFPDHDNLIYNFGIHPWVGATIHLLYRKPRPSALCRASFICDDVGHLSGNTFSEASSERPQPQRHHGQHLRCHLWGSAVSAPKTLLKEQDARGHSTHHAAGHH